jgi:hypothetical protein
MPQLGLVAQGRAWWPRVGPVSAGCRRARALSVVRRTGSGDRRAAAGYAGLQIPGTAAQATPTGRVRRCGASTPRRPHGSSSCRRSCARARPVRCAFGRIVAPVRHVACCVVCVGHTQLHARTHPPTHPHTHTHTHTISSRRSSARCATPCAALRRCSGLQQRLLRVAMRRAVHAARDGGRSTCHVARGRASLHCRTQPVCPGATRRRRRARPGGVGAVRRLPSARAADASAVALSSAIEPAGGCAPPLGAAARVHALSFAARRSLLQAPPAAPDGALKPAWPSASPAVRVGARAARIGRPVRTRL